MWFLASDTFPFVSNVVVYGRCDVLLYTADDSELAHLDRCPANSQNRPSLAGYSLIIPCPHCIAESLWILFFCQYLFEQK